MQQFLLEVSEQASRLAIYDFKSRELLAEVEGKAWQRMLEELRIGIGKPSRARCAHHASAEAPTDQTIRPARYAEGAIAQSLRPASDALPSLPILFSRPTSPTAGTAAPLNGLSGPSGSPLALKSTGRRKLWDVPHKYHCPIIGTCLTVDELRRIADRTAQRPDMHLSDFDIHVSFVASSTDRNPISSATHKTLEKKFAASVRRYAKARDADTLIALWSESLATGEVPGGLWALMTHPRADHRVLALAYEEVHMLSHQIGAGQRADLKRLAETRVQLEQLQHDFDNLSRRARQQTDLREAKIRALENALTQRESDYADSRAREHALREELAQSNAPDLRDKIAALTGRAEMLEAELTRIRGENLALRSASTQAQREVEASARARLAAEAECRAAERLLAQSLADRCAGCDIQDCARRNNLEGRLVLCVGGRKQLVEHYRAMVADCNGRFDHHDGGLEDSQHRLEAMLSSADIVVCAADYVSHGAYYRTKRFCKRHEKPHVLLGNSGVSAFALAIERLTA